MKLFHKIAVTTLGIAMATAVGAGVARYNRGDIKAAKAADRYEYNLYSGELTAGDYIIFYSGKAMKNVIDSSRFSYAEFTPANNKIVTDDTSVVWTLAKSSSYWTIYSAAVEKYAASTGAKNKAQLLASGTDDKSLWSVTGSSTYEFDNKQNKANGVNSLLRNNGTSGFACYASATGGALSLYKKGSIVADPTVTEVNVSAGEISSTYKTFASIQCSATVIGENGPSQEVVWTISSNSTYVANQTEVTGASIDDKGKVTFSDSVSVYAFATSTVTGYTSVRGSVQCTASSLKDPVTYVQLDRTQRVKAGMEVAILNNDGDYALSTTQKSNNRAAVAASHETVGDYELSHLQEDSVQLFTLVNGTQAGSFAFSYDDGGTTKYIYAAGSGGDNQLKTTTLLTDAASFTISITNGQAALVSCDSGKNGYLRYNYNNGTPMFACYNSNCNASLYIAGNSLPDIINLTSISNVQVSNMEVYSTVTLTASYLPINATEGVVVTATDNDGEVECGTPVMANGTITMTVKGVTAGAVTITLTGETTSSATASKQFTVTPFNATHTKITSTDSLFNGLKVIIGDPTGKLASGPHSGGNNIPAVTVGFNEAGTSLSNAGGQAEEYTMWQFTISEKTGWAFYSNGYFLTASTGNNNYLKRVQKLSALCLFSVTFDEGQVTIVSVDTGVTRNTMRINRNNSLISCYESDKGDGPVNLYSANSGSTNAKIAAGFEQVLLKIGSIDEGDTGTGLCKTNEFYTRAKDVYNNVLTVAQKGLLSADAIERLEAWARANGDEIVDNQLVAATNVGGLTITAQNNSPILIIAVIASITAISLAGFFLVLRKRKHQ